MARRRQSTKSTPAQNARSTKDASSPSATPKSSKRTRDGAELDWDEKFDGFELEYVKLKAKANKKRKPDRQTTSTDNDWRSAPLHAEVTSENPYPETDLTDVHCKIKPAAYWESTQRYRKFTISDEEFQVGQTVFVQQDDDSGEASVRHWLAKILEVRAADASHVFLRVYWAYRPEDLPGGRQPHHGVNELIVSNHMDIIEAVTVVESAEVVYWEDDPKASTRPTADQLFWRQSFDVNKPKSQQLSNLNRYCIDDAPCNPDEPLLKCPSCSARLHASCLEEQAIRDAFEEHMNAQTSKGKLKSPATKNNNDPAFSAFDADLTTDTGTPRLTVTDLRRGNKKAQWDVDINCLLCRQPIDAAHKSESAPPTPTPTTPAAQMDNEADDDEEEEEEEADEPVAVASSPNGLVKATMSIDTVLNDKPSKSQPEPADLSAPQPKRGRGRPRKHPKQNPGPPPGSKNNPKNEGALIAPVPEAQHAPIAPIIATTPAPPSVSANASILQSGVRSVKRLLWGSQ